MTWTPDAIAQLRTLWDEGHSTAEIGRRMGVSKGAVVGKARRLKLPPRPSPLKGGLWTREQDAALRHACATTHTWKRAGALLGISKHAARARAIKLGIPKLCARLAGRSTLPMLPSLSAPAPADAPEAREGVSHP